MQREGHRGWCGSSFGAVGRENLQDELSSEAVYYVASAVKKLKFSLCIVCEKNLKLCFKWFQKEKKLSLSPPALVLF